MGDVMEAGVPIPRKLSEWEGVLTRHFLMIGEDGDASPIRSFEVSAEVLAEAVACGTNADPAEVTKHFLNCFTDDGIIWAFEEGKFPFYMDPKKVPGCLSYLCLSLYVASQPNPEGDASSGAGVLSGQFRAKLRAVTGIDKSFSQIPGIAKMWLFLRDWLDDRRREGAPFRSLVLPIVPASWKHIGYTLRLAFPIKTDLTHLTHFLRDNPRISVDPSLLKNLSAPSDFSAGLAESFVDFRRGILAGNRYLADHPFWRLVQICDPDNLQISRSKIVFECLYDEDGVPAFSLVSDKSESFDCSGSLSAVIQLAKDIGGSAPTTASSAGFVVFIQQGYGIWKSIEAFEGSPGEYLLGCSLNSYAKLREHKSKFIRSGEWYITSEPARSGFIDTCLRSFGYKEAAVPLSPISIGGGIRTRGGWLGRNCFLPRVNADAQAVIIHPEDNASGTLKIVADPAAGGFRLESPQAVQGSWRLESEGSGRSWARRLTFVRDADVHPSEESAAHKLEIIRDWNCLSSEEPTPKNPKVGADETRIDSNIDDLLEALYSRGRSGLSEAEIIGLLGNWRRTELNPWSILSVLRDATFLVPRLRARWGGRVWTLVEPRLRALKNCVLAEGALPTRLRENFRIAVESLDGDVHVSGGDGKMPLLAAFSVDPVKLSRQLGWPIAQNCDSAGKHPKSFPATTLTTMGREPASHWEWERNAFRAGKSEGTGIVSLTRWKHSEGNDHDIYVIKKLQESYHLVSRSAAVCMAHCLAGKEMFELENGGIRGKFPEASLPDALASRLRKRHLSNSRLENEVRVYPADEKDIGWISMLIPGILKEEGGRSGIKPAVAFRHTRGIRRLLMKSRAMEVR
jgi:hypothetical protein